LNYKVTISDIARELNITLATVSGALSNISGPPHIKIFSDRLKGYLAALKAHDILPDNGLIYQGNASIESGKEAIKYFYGKPGKAGRKKVVLEPIPVFRESSAGKK
jgi:DNA-binding LacI/PurR family transcriptional regulator